MTSLERCQRNLQDAILSGEYAPGDRLPAERALAAAHGVGRVTIRSALGALVTQGLLQARQGSGYVVRPLSEAHLGTALLPDVARLGTLALPDLARDLLRLRRHLAAALIEHFMSMDTVDVVAPERALGKFEALAHSGAKPAALAKADRAVLEALVKASRSLTFELTLFPVTRVLMAVEALHPIIYSAPSTNVAAYRGLLAWLAGDRSTSLPLLQILEARDEHTLKNLP